MPGKTTNNAGEISWPTTNNFSGQSGSWGHNEQHLGAIWFPEDTTHIFSVQSGFLRTQQTSFFRCNPWFPEDRTKNTSVQSGFLRTKWTTPRWILFPRGHNKQARVLYTDGEKTTANNPECCTHRVGTRQESRVLYRAQRTLQDALYTHAD